MSADVDEVAAVRGAAPAQRSPRMYANHDHEDRVGALGERHFARAFGLPWDTAPKPLGDGGFDFSIRVRGRTITIDVKTSLKPLNMLVKEADMYRCADLLVLCGVFQDEAYLVGWEHKSIMGLAPVGDFNGLRCHFRRSSELRDIAQLADLMGRRE